MRCCIPLLFATGCALIATGCALINAQADAERAHELGLRIGTSTRFVTTESAWVCPTIPAALAGTACKGGLLVRKNRAVSVIGKAAVGGAWPVAHYAPHGDLIKRYVAATAVDTIPDTRALATYAQDVARRYPEERRIEIGDLDVESIFTEPDAYRGRYLVVRQLMRTLKNKTWEAGRFTFTIKLPVSAGSHFLKHVQFELANSELVDELEAGEHSYECGPEYCDDFVIVAELTDRTVERVDEIGEVRTLPVFAVRELGDRYGSYTSK